MGTLLVLIIKLPFQFLGYLFRHKVLLIIVVIGVAIFGITHSFNQHNQPVQAQVTVPKWQTSAPLSQVAPKVVQTPSRVYYVSALSDDGKQVILQRFYEYTGKGWQLMTTPLPLKKSDTKIYERGGAK